MPLGTAGIRVLDLGDYEGRGCHTLSKAPQPSHLGDQELSASVPLEKRPASSQHTAAQDRGGPHK